MKFLIGFLALVFGCNSAMAQAVSGDITNIDAAAKTISVSVNGGDPKLYKLRLAAEVLINGQRKKVEDLAVGMKAKITSGDPGYASRIEAIGAAPNPAGVAPATGEKFEDRLIGTEWIWQETDAKRTTLKFKPNGVAIWTSGKFTWEVSPGGGNRIEGATSFGKKYKMTFDENLTTGTIYIIGAWTQKTKRVN